MLSIQLFIENETFQQVELFKDESITLTQSIQDIKDVSKLFTDYSRTFNCPASKQNNKIFKHFYNYHIDGFDARTKKNAKLYVNFKEYKEGKIKFEGVELKNNKPHTYKLTFFGNTVNFKDKLGETKLSNLKQLRLFNFDYNSTNVAEYLVNGKDVQFFTEEIIDAIVFPLITTESRIVFDSNSSVVNTAKIKNARRFGNSTNYGIPMSELKPAIRIYAIIRAIELQFGFEFSRDFFTKENVEFYNIYMWLHNKEGGLFTDQSSQYPITGLGNITGDNNFIRGVTTNSFVNEFDDSKDKRELRINVKPNGTGSYNLVIKKDGEEFQRWDNLVGTTTNSSTTNKVVNLEIPQGTYTFFIETVVASSYETDITIIHDLKGFLKGKREITIRDGGTSFQNDQNINISSIIPDMLSIDFVVGLFKMFNLTAYTEASGKVIVKSLDEYYTSSTKIWDITDHVDATQKTVQSVLPYKDITFKYKGTKSFLANNHLEIANKAWGESTFVNENDGERFVGKDYKIEIPFEHFKYERLFTTDDGVVALSNGKKVDSPIQYGYSVDAKQEPYLGEPLLFYAVKGFASVGVINLDASANVEISSPYMPMNSIGFLWINGVVGQSLNYHPEIDEYERIPNDRTLYKTYYESYIKDIFDVRKRLTSVKAYLPLNMTLELNLADKIVLFNNLYRINKITTDFNTNLSNLELTNVLQEDVTYQFDWLKSFSTLTAVALNCLTVDSDIITSDSLNVKVDASCDTEFDIPDISLESPNSDDNPPNDPVSTLFDVPLKVTPAVINSNVLTPTATATSVSFGYKVTTLGQLQDTPQVEEYGFLYSTSETDLKSSDDVDVLKAKSSVTAVPYIPQNIHSITGDVVYTKTGLTNPATIYWRFYARTNIDPVHAKADAISSVNNVTTISLAGNSFGNASGQTLGEYIFPSDYGAIQFLTSLSGFGGEPNVLGQVISQPFNKWTEDEVKKVVEWFSSVADPSPDTYYDVSHTWKWVSNAGSDGVFAVGDVSNSEISYGRDQFNYLRIWIKGSASISGNSNLGGSANILSSDSWTGDLQSTS